MPILTQSSRGAIHYPNSKKLKTILKGVSSHNFLGFIEACLQWDPKLRITPKDALNHDWIQEGVIYSKQ